VSQTPPKYSGDTIVDMKAKGKVGVALAVAATAVAAAGFRHTPKASAGYQNEVKMTVAGGVRTIESNGIPDHSVGAFPNDYNPNTIAPQKYVYKVPTEPKAAEHRTRGGNSVFGVAINGVPFDPGTAELWNRDMRWHYEALSGYIPANRGGLGVDQNLAHVQPNGAYHYHGLPYVLLEKLDYKKKMALVGYAADGFPIYGPYAYSDPNDAKSPLKELKSSYVLKKGQRPGGDDGPGGEYDGSFRQDYDYLLNAGDLDLFNGRTGVTPEYPNGTFYYVLTKEFPFVPRYWKGTPDPSFSKRGG
jgi:hypothetical protein